MKKLQSSPYEFPIEDIARVGRPGEPAGIYLLDGAWHLAAHDSLAEALLVLAGALHVATLAFPTTSRAAAVSCN